MRFKTAGSIVLLSEADGPNARISRFLMPGLTYSDVIDGAHWAVKQGITDPGKVCIVGWSFGGYAALLGATRNSDLFRCSVAIAGVSDLSLLEQQEANFISGAISREQIGTNSAKLKADSPRNFAANINIPVLMIHGDNDAQVNVEQSIAMERALSKAHKAHEFILIKGAEHSMSRESDRTTLLSAIDKFLAANLHWARTAATTEPALAWRKRARLLGFTRGALVVSSAWYAAELLAMKPCASPEWPVNTDRPAI